MTNVHYFLWCNACKSCRRCKIISKYGSEFQIQTYKLSKFGFILPFLEVTVVYKATWQRSNKAKVGAIVFERRCPHCPRRLGRGWGYRKGCWAMGQVKVCSNHMFASIEHKGHNSCTFTYNWSTTLMCNSVYKKKCKLAEQISKMMQYLTGSNDLLSSFFMDRLNYADWQHCFSGTCKSQTVNHSFFSILLKVFICILEQSTSGLFNPIQFVNICLRWKKDSDSENSVGQWTIQELRNVVVETLKASVYI